MADRTIKINIRTDAEQALVTVEDLKTELKSLKSQFEGETIGTQAFNDLGTQIKSVSKEIKDVNNQVKSLDSNQQTAALVDTFRGLVGAVGAVSAAFVAFGADASAIEDVEKKLLGIIGVVQGFSEASKGLVALNKLTGGSFNNLGTSIKSAFTTATGSINGFKVALASVGIGLLIAGVVKLVEIFNSADNAIKANEDSLIQAKAAYDAFAISVEQSNEGISRQSQLLSAQAELAGKSAKDILKIQEDALNEELFNIAQKLDVLTKSYDKQRKLAISSAKAENNGKLKAAKDFDIEFLKQQAALNKQLYDGDVKFQLLGINFEKQQSAESKKIADQAVQDQKARNKNLQDALINEAESKRQLAIQLEDDEKKRRKLILEDELADLKVAQEAALAQDNLTKEARKAINAKFENDVKIAEDKFTNDITDIDKAAEIKRIADAEKAASDLIEFQKRAFDGEIKALGEFYTARENEVKTQFEQGLITQQQYDTQLDQLELTRLNNILQATKDAGESTIAVEKDILDKKIALKDKDVETTKKTEEQKKALQDLAFDSALSLIGDLQSLNEIFDNDSEEASKKAFNRNKNLSIAEAIISTYLAAQKAYTSQLTLTPDSPIRASIAAAVAIASGLARVAVIKSQKFDGGGSTSGGGTAGGSTGSSSGGNILNPFATEGGGTNILPPRLAPPSGGSGTQAGNQQQGLGNIPIVKAYVLAGDVTDAQVANEKINQKRKF